MTHNANCDGDKCERPDGKVRLYPTGNGGNLILCRSCFSHENGFRKRRGLETGEPQNWPLVPWATAKPYPEA